MDWTDLISNRFQCKNSLYLLSFLLLSLFYYNDFPVCYSDFNTETIEYKVKLFNPEYYVTQVIITVKNSSRSSHEFSLRAENEPSFYELKIVDFKGNLLEFNIRKETYDYILIIKNDPLKNFQILYNSTEMRHGNENFRIFWDDFLLFRPNFEYKILKINFDLPENWLAVTPWDGYNNSFTIGEFGGKYISVGPAEIVERVIQKNFIRIGFVAEAIEHKEILLNQIETLFTECFSIFGPYPNELILVIAAPEGGSCVGNTFHFNFHDAIENNGWVLSHEMFHLWNGQLIHIDSNGGWFNEGFNQYYGYKNLYETGIWSDRDYYDELFYLYQLLYKMDILGTKYDVPLIKTEEYVEIENDYMYYHLVDARKAAIIAYMLDNEILIYTNGTKSLDDVYVYLYENYELKNRPISHQDILYAVNRVTKVDFEAFFENYVYNITLLDLESDLGDPDHDGLPSKFEIIIGTDPHHYDTDRDFVGDVVELDYGLNPLVKDSNDDGISDLENITIACDGYISDWENIEPLLDDKLGDNEVNVSGTDLKALYTFMDEEYLYLMIELYDPPPNPTDTYVITLEFGTDDEFYFQCLDFLGGINLWDKDEVIHPSWLLSRRGEAVEIQIPLEKIGFPEMISIRCHLHCRTDDLDQIAEAFDGISTIYKNIEYEKKWSLKTKNETIEPNKESVLEDKKQVEELEGIEQKERLEQKYIIEIKRMKTKNIIYIYIIYGLIITLIFTIIYAFKKK